MRKTNKSQTKPDTAKQKKTRDMRRFITIVSVIVGTFTVVSTVFAYFYVQTTVAKSTSRPSLGMSVAAASTTSPGQAETLSAPEESIGGFIANLLLPPETTNFLIAGVNNADMLSDVILVGNFDRDTQEITVISIPRDTRITLSKEHIKELNDLGRYPPSHGVMRLNAITAYAGRTHGMDYLRKHLENMLSIDIDYYAQVDLRAFRNIVDAVGGIYMDIPAGGYYYEDPEQNLSIRVPAGNQLLDGAKAEGVVRYRATYIEGDLKRITVQQEFMKQFFAQVLNKESIVNNLGSFLMTIISYVRTDFGIADLPLYLRYATSLKAENITFLTLPGNAPPVAEGEASYYYHDLEKTVDMIRDVFYKESSVEPEEVEITNNMLANGLRVQLLNGGVSVDDFEKTTQTLEAAGVNVIEKGEFTGIKREGTRVFTRQTGGSDVFRQFFSGMTEEISVGFSDRFDAVIILGSSQTG